MCSLTVGLMAAQMGMSMYQQNAQYHAQKQALDFQAQQAKWNAAAEEHKAEKIAENYAIKQQQNNDRYRLAVGNARAQFGASGLDSSGGSLEDVLGASTDAYNRDSQNLLSSQREDEWASYVKQTNYLNEMNAYNQMKKQAKSQRNIGFAGSLLSGASSIYGQGYKEGLWGSGKSSTPLYSGSSLGSSTNYYDFSNIYKKNANYGLGGIMP